MRFRTTLILFIILVALGFYIKLVDEKQLSTDQKKIVDKKTLRNFDTDYTMRVTIEGFAEPEIAFERQAGGWKMTSPLGSRADNATLGDILSEVKGLESIRILPKDQSGKYGVAGSSRRLTLENDTGSKTVFRFGNKASLGDLVYVGLSGREDLIVIKDALVSLIDKPVDAFRDPRLTTLSQYQAIHFNAKYGDTYVSCDKVDEKWIIRSHDDVAADREAVEDYLRDIAYLTAKRFVKDGDIDLAQFGLDLPWYRVVVRTELEEEIEIAFGDAVGDNGAYYVKEARTDTVYSVEISKRDMIKDISFFRDKHIITAKKESVQKILIESQEESFSLVRGPDVGWSLEGLPDLSREKRSGLEIMSDRIFDLKFVQVASRQKEKYIQGDGFSDFLMRISFMDENEEPLQKVEIFDAVEVSDDSLLLCLTSNSDEVYTILIDSVADIINIFDKEHSKQVSDDNPAG